MGGVADARLSHMVRDWLIMLMTLIARWLPNWLVASGLILSAPLYAADVVSATTAPTSRRAVGDAQAMALLEKLSNDKSLRLTGGPDSVFNNFEFVLTIAAPDKAGRLQATTFLVASDGEALAVLSLASDGSPYAFAKTGFFVGFSRTIPGRLIVCNRGAAGVLVGADEANGDFQLELFFSRKLPKPTLLVDLGSIIRTATAKLQEVRYDARENTLSLTTPNSEMRLALSGDAGGGNLPLAGMVLHASNGLLITVSDLTTEIRHPELFAVDKASVEKLGLPMHVLGEGEAARVPFFVPPTFGSREKEREAITRFRGLFPDLAVMKAAPPTTQQNDDDDDAPRKQRVPPRRPLNQRADANGVSNAYPRCARNEIATDSSIGCAVHQRLRTRIADAGWFWERLTSSSL